MGKKPIKALFLIGVFLMALLLSGCGGNPDGAKQQQAHSPQNAKREIRIGYQTAGSVIIIAKAKGWYEEEFAKDGTAVKYAFFPAGPQSIEAFAGGQQDVGTTGDMPPISGKAAGVDIKIIGRSYFIPFSNGLLVRPDSTIANVKELKGKKVAVQVGSTAHHFLILLLQKNGLNPGEVNIVNLTAADQQVALESGNVDAVSTWEPWVSSLEGAKAGKIIADSTGVKRTIGLYLARNDFAVENPDLVERFLKVNKRTVDYIKANPDEALALLSRETKIPAESLRKSFLATDWDMAITDQDAAALAQVKDFLKETKVIKNDFVINDLIELKYLKGAGLM